MEAGRFPFNACFAKIVVCMVGWLQRAYLPELLNEVLEGRLNPAPNLDLSLSLDEVAAGYAAMDQRQVIKVMVRP
jgi:threonine dehydrogenase-like Zn-dependent dehydrogenase